MPDKYRHTFYEVYVSRGDKAVSSKTSKDSIDRDEWLAFVEQEEDIELSKTATFANGISCDQPAWKFKSYPEGTPVFFEQGKIFIREDDSETIERLVTIARQFDAKVTGEDGTVFDELSDLAEPVTSLDQTVAKGVKIPFDDELIRKRQSALAFIILLIFPVYVVWQIVSGNNPGSLYLWGFGSLLLAGYAAVCFFQTKFYLLYTGGKTSTLYQLDTQSTSDKIVCKTIQNTQLNPLELIWFPLEYPGKTKIEYHVRSQKQPSLVFFASANKEKAQTMLRKIAQKMIVKGVDLSYANAAENIPQKYQLTREEMGKRRKKKLK